MAEPLNTTRATRKNAKKNTKAENSEPEVTVSETTKTNRSARRTTKASVVEESAMELQPKSNKR